MDRIYVEFFRKLLNNADNLSAYVDSLYAEDEYTEDDLNSIFNVLENEGLIDCDYGDDRAWIDRITYKGKHYFDGENNSRIAILIDKVDEIERLFHKVGGNGFPVVETIHDVQEFQDWFQEIHLELRNIHNRTNDYFIWETLNDFNRNMNGWTDRQIFSEIKGKLKAIRRNLSKYYADFDKELENEATEELPAMVEKKCKIFISHSSKDVKYVSNLVNLLDGMGLNQTQVFCSSLPGYGIPIGTNIFDYLRNQFLEYNLHIIFVHSDNYYSSPISLNEMGAAWVLRSTVTSILLPKFEYKQMTGVVDNQAIAIKVDAGQLEVQDKLNQLYDKIVAEFGLTRKSDIIWQQKRDSFINDMQQ